MGRSNSICFWTGWSGTRNRWKWLSIASSTHWVAMAQNWEFLIQGDFSIWGLAVPFKPPLKNGCFSTVTWSPQAMLFSIPGFCELDPSGWELNQILLHVIPLYISAWQNFYENNTSCQGFYKLYMIRMISINEWFPLTDSPFRRRLQPRLCDHWKPRRAKHSPKEMAQVEWSK